MFGYQKKRGAWTEKERFYEIEKITGRKHIWTVNGGRVFEKQGHANDILPSCCVEMAEKTELFELNESCLNERQRVIICKLRRSFDTFATNFARTLQFYKPLEPAKNYRYEYANTRQIDT